MQADQQRRIGQFEIGRTLGKGMSAKVKLGRDAETGELVALKIIDKSSPTPRQMELLNREITAMKSISHPNILSLDAVNMSAAYPRKCGLIRECILLALEFADNGELFDFLMYSGAFPEIVARTYFHQLMGALEACHARGIFHRDIKPENLLLDGNFQLKVADFGLSAINNSDDPSTHLLRTECGTRSYMPPEMLKHRAYEGSKADVWSSLVVLFIMLSGNPPFQQASESDWWFKQIKNNRRDRFWRAHLKSAPFFPAQAREFVDRTFIVNPEQRPGIEQIINDPWMRGDVLGFDQLREHMAYRKNQVEQRKEQERQAELAKMQAQQQQRGGGAFDPFGQVMRSVEAPPLPTDQLGAPHTMYSAVDAPVLLRELAQNCQERGWEVTEKEQQFKLKVETTSPTGKIEWVAQIYSAPQDGLNVVQLTRRAGDLMGFLNVARSVLNNEQSGTESVSGLQMPSPLEEADDDDDDDINENEDSKQEVEDVISDEIDVI